MISLQNYSFIRREVWLSGFLKSMSTNIFEFWGYYLAMSWVSKMVSKNVWKEVPGMCFCCWNLKNFRVKTTSRCSFIRVQSRHRLFSVCLYGEVKMPHIFSKSTLGSKKSTECFKRFVLGLFEVFCWSKQTTPCKSKYQTESTISFSTRENNSGVGRSAPMLSFQYGEGEGCRWCMYVCMYVCM